MGICDLSEKSLTESEKSISPAILRHRYSLCCLLKSWTVTIRFLISSVNPFTSLVLLRDKKNNTSLGLIPVPSFLRPFVPMPGDERRFVRIERIIRGRIDQLFGEFRAEDCCILSVTRNADISFDEEKFDDFDGEDFEVT